MEPIENVALANVTVEDCQVLTTVEEEAQQNAANPKKQSQAWADSTEEAEEVKMVGSEKPQEESKENKQKTEVTIQVRSKTYCPVCTVDSHSEEHCARITVHKQSNKRKLGRQDSKPGKGESVGKKIKSIAKFKADLESVVLRGDNSSSVQYVVEMDDSGELYALTWCHAMAKGLLLSLPEISL